MGINTYLENYRRIVSRDLSRGLGGAVRSYLDAKASRQGQPNRHAFFLKRILDLLTPDSLVSPKNILEVGCGNGWALSYRSSNISCYAVDNGTTFQADLESRGVEYHSLNISSSTLPFSQDYFDLIMLNHVIEHITAYDHMMSELTRVLKPSGHLYIRTPDIKRVGMTFFDDYTHVKPYSREGLTALMSAFGLRPVFVYYSDHARINMDILTNGRLRHVLFGRVFGGNEIEAAFVKA